MAAIGFIGIGTMGGAMATRMIEMGGSLVVYDSNPVACARLAERGAAVAKSPRDVADHAETVFACLPSAEVSLRVVMGEDGVIRGSQVRTYVETSTIGIAPMREIAQSLAGRDINVVDGPISGAVLGARAGTLSMMASGPEEGIAALQPLLPLFTRKFFYLGSQHGAAQMCKLVNNAIACVGMYAACEAIAAGLKAGLNDRTLLEVINASSGANLFTREAFPAFILSHQFSGAGPIEIGAKDLSVFVQEAEALGASAPLAATAAAAWWQIAGNGEAGRDNSDLFLQLCRRAGFSYPEDVNDNGAGA